MPIIQGSEAWEYDLEIESSGSTFSVDNGDFDVEGQCLLEMGELQIPHLQFCISLNATTLNFAPLCPVRIKTRSVGEPTWLIRFTGILNKVDWDDERNTIDCAAMGREAFLKSNEILHAEFGNAYVEDQAQQLNRSTSTAYGSDVYATLDSSFTLQTPLIKASAHSGERTLLMGDGDATLAIYDDGAGAGQSQTVAIGFYHTGGNLWGILVGLEVTNIEGTTGALIDLVCSIETPTAIDDITPDGTEILTGSISQALITSVTYYYIAFENQTTFVSPGWYVARFYQRNGHALTTVANPGWKLHGVASSSEPLIPAYISNDGGSTWSYDSNNFPYFAADSENSHVLLKYGDDYIVKRVSNTNYAYLVKWGDFSRNRKPIINLLGQYSNSYTPFTRWSYWKGDLDYSSTLEDLCQDWARPYYDVLDIAVTQPSLAFQGLVIDKKTTWDALLEFRKYNDFAWRIWEDLSGTFTLEIYDKLQPGNWASQTAAYQTAHTFKHGDDDTDPEQQYTRLTKCKLGCELESIINTYILINNNGDVFCDQDPSGDLGLSFPTYGTGYSMGGLAQQGAMAQIVLGQLKTFNYRGEIGLTDFDMSTSSAVFLSCNELIYIVSSNMNINGAYVPRRIVIDFANGGDVQIELADKTLKTFKSTFGGFGGDLMGHGGALKDFDPNLLNGVTIAYEEGMGNRSGASMNGGITVIQGGAFGATYATGDTFAVGLGIGSPGGPDTLGTEVAQADCEIYELSGGGCILRATIDKTALTSTSYGTNGVTISELLLTKNSVPLSAKSIGTDRDGGSMDIVEPRPRMYGRDHKITVCIRLGAT